MHKKSITIMKITLKSAHTGGSANFRHGCFLIPRKSYAGSGTKMKGPSGLAQKWRHSA